MPVSLEARVRALEARAAPADVPRVILIAPMLPIGVERDDIVTVTGAQCWERMAGETEDEFLARVEREAQRPGVVVLAFAQRRGEPEATVPA